MVPLEADLNLVKGRLMQNFEPWQIEETVENQTPLRELARTGARNNNERLLNDALTQIRLVFAVFEYLNSADASPRFLRVLRDMETEWQNLQDNTRDIWRQEHPDTPDPALRDWYVRWVEDQNELVGRKCRHTSSPSYMD